MDIVNGEFMQMLLRIIVTCILCGLVGFEREIKDQPAGLRTHILVGVGACAMMLFNQFGLDAFEGNNITNDMTRIPAYIISGIGFLGAGTIIVNGKSVRGLATAGSIWLASIIGIVTGVGMYRLSLIVTVIVLVSLFLLSKLKNKLEV